jgi:hypothetical protein
MRVLKILEQLSGEGVRGAMVRKISCYAKGHDTVRHQCCSALNLHYTLYPYGLSDGVNNWEISKWYSDFDALDKDLQNRYLKRMLKIERIPRKSKFNALKPRNIEAREKEFDNYVQQLMHEGELLASPEVREFLEIPMEVAMISDNEFDVDHEPATANSDGSDPSTPRSQQASEAGWCRYCPLHLA